MVEVVAALIWEDDRFLVCQRSEYKARPLLWEFPGGKMEPGESPKEALIRECLEELGIVLSVGSDFADTVYAYDEITIHLTVFNATIAEGTLKLLEHADQRWIKISEIPLYTFCPADAEIVKYMQ